MSLKIQAALQSRIDRRTNVIREMEDERRMAKVQLRFAYEDMKDGGDDYSSVKWTKINYHSICDDLIYLAAEQKLDKVLLKQQVFNARQKRVKKNLRSVLADAGYENVVVV